VVRLHSPPSFQMQYSETCNPCSRGDVSCAGSIFGQIRVALNDPTRIPSVLGAALPASSNFFVSCFCTLVQVLLPLQVARAIYVAVACLPAARSGEAMFNMN